MLAYIVRRLLQSILVLVAVGFIAFSLFTFVGDPVNNMVGVHVPRCHFLIVDQIKAVGTDPGFRIQPQRRFDGSVRWQLGRCRTRPRQAGQAAID